MKTKMEYIAPVIATAIWADGEYDEYNKQVVKEIAEAFKLEEAAFVQLIDAEVAKLEKASTDEVNAMLLAAGKEIDEAETGMVFEAAIEIVLADGVLTREEGDNLLAIADAIGLSHTDALLLVADMVNSEEDIEIVF